MKVIARKADICNADLSKGGVKNAEQSQIQKPIKGLKRKTRFYSGGFDKLTKPPNP